MNTNMNTNMNTLELENQILDVKDPNEIIKMCDKNDVWKVTVYDENSFIWSNLIYKYYDKYYDFKDRLSLKDFYVLLYYLDMLNLIDNYNLLTKCQNLLKLLPRIYEGDHLAIIHAASNIAIQINKSNIVLYRKKDDITPVFGGGFLRARYLKSENDIYLNKTTILDTIKSAKGVNKLFGGFNPNLN